MDDVALPRQTPIVRNVLLQSLLRSDAALILPDLECVTVAAGSVVFDTSTPGIHAIFPAECILSLRSILPEGGTSEMALISRDGVVGLGALGVDPPVSSYKALYLHLQWRAMRAGTAWRLPVRLLRELMDTSPHARAALMERYDRLVLEFIVRAQCNRHHRIDEQLCGWLVRYRSLSGSDEVVCTQQEIADIIGVRREGITEALGRLQALGAVSCGRGRLGILNAAVLAARACNCQRMAGDFFSANSMAAVATNTADNPTALRKVSA
jgi:CRP-like cAMP-binding protein